MPSRRHGCSCVDMSTHRLITSQAVQVLHALVEAGEVGRAKECLQLYGLAEDALQADIGDEALQAERRRCAPPTPVNA